MRSGLHWLQYNTVFVIYMTAIRDDSRYARLPINGHDCPAKLYRWLVQRQFLPDGEMGARMHMCIHVAFDLPSGDKMVTKTFFSDGQRARLVWRLVAHPWLFYVQPFNHADKIIGPAFVGREVGQWRISLMEVIGLSTSDGDIYVFKRCGMTVYLRLLARVGLMFLWNNPTPCHAD